MCKVTVGQFQQSKTFSIQVNQNHPEGTAL